MAKKMSKKEIDSFIKSTNITQEQYVAPTVQRHVDTRNVPAMAAVSQTVKQPQVQPVQQTVNTVTAPTTQTVKTKDLDLSPKNIGKAIGKAAKIAGKTIANVPTLLAEGALKTGESVIDTANDLSDAVNNFASYGAIKTIYGKNKADKWLKKEQKNQEQFLKRNLVNDFENLTGWSKEKNKWEKDSLINSENLGGQVVQEIGGMVPALLAGQYAGLTPNLTSLQGLSGAAKAKAIAGNIGQTYLSQLPSNAILSASSYGGGLEEALNDGATRGQARKYGLANAAIEQGTEMLTGGVPGLEGRGGLDSLIEPLVDRNTNGYLNALIKAGYGAAGEGLEEYAGTMLEPLAKKIYSDEKINWDEVRKQARQAGLVGAATGAILNSPQNLQDIRDVRNENRVRRAIGDAEYAEGNNQYNPEYKGWEAQREENRQQEEIKRQEQEERNQRVEENNRLRQQEQQTQENNINTQETTNVAENALNDTIEASTPRSSYLKNLDNNDRQNLENIYAKQRSGERLNKNELEQLQYLRRKSNNLKNPELKTNNTMQDLYDNKDYNNYYTKANLDNFDETILSKAKETIQANKQGKRTKQEWLDVAKNIGLQADNMNSEQLKQYAFASFKDARPNIKDNLNRQGQKYVDFKLNEWVNAVYDGAGVGKPINTLKQEQNRIIQESNPMTDDYHVGIRNENDIKTFNEAINDDESFTWGDYSKEDAQRDLEKGTVTVYSSKPIENGNFVSTSRNQARDYAGGENAKIYSKEVPINEVAWINGDEGQYAKVESNKTNLAAKDAYKKVEVENEGTSDSSFNNEQNNKLASRVSGDALLDAQDLINTIKDVGANVDDNGYVTLYHQTTPENAQRIIDSGKMSSKENAVFFSTSENASQADGRGTTKLEFKVPAENLELDDLFSDNADVKIPLNGSKELDVSDYLVKDNIAETNATEKVEEPVVKVETPQQEKQHFVDNGVNEEVAKVLSEMPKVEKQPLREKIKENKAKIGEEWSYLKRNLVDKGETIYTLGKKTKNPNLYAKYDKRGTTSGEANYDIGVAQTNLEGKRFNNFTDKNGKKKSMSLNEIWEGVDPEVANEYLAHYLNVDRYNQTNEDGTQKYVFGESVTDQDSLKRIAELEQEHPELKRFGENVWQYGKNQLQNRVDAGQISQEQANQFLKDTPHYVRLQRNVDTKTSPLIEFDKKGNVKVNKNLKEFKGSTLDILPFKESMAQYTLDVRNSIRDNLFAQELAKTLGIDGNGEVVNDLDDIMGTNPELLKDNGDGTYSLTFFNKGVATTIPINEGIYESLQPNKHYKFEDTLPFKGIRKFDNFRKALLTDKNPLFLATNMMKDAFDAPLNSKYPAQFVKNYPRAIKEIATNGKYYQQYQALGGLQNTYFDNKSFQKEGSKLNPMTWIEKGNNAVEQFPRLAEFISTMEKTGDIDKAMYNAAEITTNFKRGGDWTRAANRNGVTFLNASMQGFSKQIRNFTDIQEPRQAVQLLGKIVALGIAPGLINDAMWDDDDEYKELQDYQKDNYYLFKGKDGQWIRIPKGRAISVFQSAARRTKYALGGDEKAFNGFVDFAKNQVAPNSPFENNILSPITNVKENKSWSGNKIVNDSMAKRPEAEQFNEKTDEFSKWLGKKLNYSPMKINYLLDQYSGVVGDVTLPAITARSSSSTSNPIIASAKDKFTLDAVNSNKSVGTFYDVKDEIEKQKNSIKSTPIDGAKNSYMTSQSIALSDLYKKQKEIQNSDLSKKEKYKQAREIQKEINEFAKETVKNVQNIEEEKYYLKIGDSYYKRVIKDGEEKYVKDSSKKIPTEKYALYDYFKSKYEKSKESD